ncbi:unnamed protein product [Orchesella dallaii]|uniref:BZIP domain-containing protein n=1 Tax=Orchesella dallaii TaxID=48710 RepID=A0ABP1RIQ7_9HEXA
MEEFCGDDMSPSCCDELLEELFKDIPVPNVERSSLMCHSDITFPEIAETVQNPHEIFPSISSNDGAATTTAPNENLSNLFCDEAFPAPLPLPPQPSSTIGMQIGNISGVAETTDVTIVDLTSDDTTEEQPAVIVTNGGGGFSNPENAMMIDQTDSNANSWQDASAAITVQIVENLETEKVKQSNIKPKRQRREKKTFLYEQEDKSNWKVARAEKQRGYRLSQKEKEKQQANTISVLQVEVKKLQNELEEHKGIPIATPVQTVKMIDYFRKAVSQLPNNCQIKVPQEVAEMRAPLMTEDKMEKIRRDLGQDEQVPEPFLSVKTTASVSFFSFN